MTNKQAIHELKNAAFLGTAVQLSRVEEAVQMAIRALNNEAGEAVRCIGCKHWEMDWEPEPFKGKRYCGMLDGFTDADFYCAVGERKEEKWIN